LETAETEAAAVRRAATENFIFAVFGELEVCVCVGVVEGAVRNAAGGKVSNLKVGDS
jgi:hypothetical protein